MCLEEEWQADLWGRDWEAEERRARREADFLRAMREGTRPDGSAIDGFMPWRVYSAMTDVELRAIWAHLSTLPPADGRAGG